MEFLLQPDDEDEDIRDETEASGSDSGNHREDEDEIGWDSFLGSEKTPIAHSPTYTRTDDRRKKDMTVGELEQWFQNQCRARVDQCERKQQACSISQLRALQTALDDELDMFSLDTHAGDELVRPCSIQHRRSKIVASHPLGSSYFTEQCWLAGGKVSANCDGRGQICAGRF
eukprot:SAG31_NODE_2511_length_5585_cov_2.160408_4_plen_172_part_00